MGFFSFLFGGKYPSTKKYEAQLEQQFAEYERFKQISASTHYARFKELEALTSSAEFKNQVNKLKTEKFSNTEAYRKEQELKNLKNSSDIKQYIKFKSKQLDQRLEMAKNSSEYQRFKDLEQAVNSPEFRQMKYQKDFKKSEAAQTEKEYLKIKNSSSVKFINKTEASDAYKNFVRVNNSDRLKKVEELEEYVKSADFLSLKAEMEDPKRFKKSNEAQLIAEFERLQKDKDIVWFQTNEKKRTFDAISKLKLTFSDEFTSLDKNKWDIGYFWGKALANTVYSLENERQCFTEKNVHVAGSELSISTIKQAAKGTRWNPAAFGFVAGEFDYTSSLINTGKSFRQKFGRFDFKVKMSQSAPIVHHVWLVGEKQEPMINVACFGKDKDKIRMGKVSNGSVKTMTIDGADLSKDYYIISLIWTADKLVWLINGVEVMVQKDNVPQDAMYINFSSHVTSKGDVQNGELNVDWVRVYELG